MAGRFHLSLRDILWLTLLCAGVVAMLHTHQRDVAQLHDLVGRGNTLRRRAAAPPLPMQHAASCNKNSRRPATRI
jgi:hypothetical protein